MGSYETAWTWLHKLRRAMVRPGRDRLTCEIEVDETYVGGTEEGKRGREVEKKSIVVVAAEKNGRAIGRIRLKRVKDVSAESLLDFIRETVEPGATMAETNRLTKSCRAFIMSPRYSSAGFSALFKVVQHQHLDYYLDEFTFRINRRRSNTRGLLFYRLTQQAVAVAQHPTVPLFAASLLKALSPLVICTNK